MDYLEESDYDDDVVDKDWEADGDTSDSSADELEDNLAMDDEGSAAAVLRDANKAPEVRIYMDPPDPSTAGNDTDKDSGNFCFFFGGGEGFFADLF